MEITEVKVFPIQEEKLKAFVSIVLDHCFMVNDIKIIQGRDGLFISMPSRKKKSGEFKDVAHPLNNETRRMIEDKVLGEYERVLAERGERVERTAAHPQSAASAAGAALAAGAADGAGSPAPAGQVPLAAAAGHSPANDATPGTPGTPGNAGNAGNAAHPSNIDPPAAPPSAPAPEKTLEEIEEMHLRDSFWTT
jgi:stage V sporulation protein G